MSPHICAPATSCQALEPEAVAPVATLLGPAGQLVLAGDPKQLGPIIHHDLAKEYGLSKSLLERIMERPLYGRTVAAAQPGGPPSHDPRVLTKLVRNFRSHPDILELPNKLFYNGAPAKRAHRRATAVCVAAVDIATRGRRA